jgi:hypothetical protein
MTEHEAALEAKERLAKAGLVNVTVEQRDYLGHEAEYTIMAWYPTGSGMAFVTNKWRPEIVLNHVDKFIEKAKEAGLV